ncbi:MAG: hypothetical protein ABT11_09030 [Novosphingobium sp. SCN 66-18]|jgi:flagellar assembly protein FliH|nr:MAG: hypothetical protein ABT11_09030 [Novosphingobium sp. SCN 66-18]
MSEPTRAVALSALTERRVGFAPDKRFVGGGRMEVSPLARRAHTPPAPVVEHVPEPEPENPVTRAFADGYAKGHAEGRSAAEAEAAIADATRHRIEMAMTRMDGEQLALLHERLRETVLALCQSVLDEAAIAPDRLTERVRIAAGMLARAQDARVIRLHPEDLALVAHNLPEDWHFEPDPALERGSIRVEGTQGGVEDGPEQWRIALQESLRAC